MLNKLLKRFFLNRNDRRLKQIKPSVQAINDLEAKYSEYTDDDLRQAILDFRSDHLENNRPLKDLLVDVFAIVREASKRTLHLRHFDVQLIGGIALFDGSIAEMKTGEGKTLVATLPAVLYALTGKGVHIVTVNDYLANRDYMTMGPLYEFLGLTVDKVISTATSLERQRAYQADIVYITNNELGFDFLRDNMAHSSEYLVQRPLYFVSLMK